MGIDDYAKILGGESHKQERKASLRGLNQIINLYTQQKQNEHKEKQKDKKKSKFNKKDYPTFAQLQKQILSKIFRKEIIIENDSDLIRELRFFIEKSSGKVPKAKDLLEFFLGWEKNEIDLTKVYLPKNKINSFAYKVFKEPQEFLAVFREGRSNLDFVNFAKVKAHFEAVKLEYKDFFQTLVKEKQEFDAFLFLLKHEIDLLIDGGATVIKGETEDVVSLGQKGLVLEEKLKWFSNKVKKDEKMTDEEEGKWCSAVLAYSEAVTNISRRAEIFWLNEKQDEKIVEKKDIAFYKRFEELVNDDFVPFFYFDKFGNYLKKRSRNTSKEIKLYFGEDHLLDGWDINKENSYCGFLLREGSNSNFAYYLGIGHKDANIFHKTSNDGKTIEVAEAYKVSVPEGFYEKIEYKQLNIDNIEGIIFGKKKKGDTKKELEEKSKRKKRELTIEFLLTDEERARYKDISEEAEKERFLFPKMQEMDKLFEIYNERKDIIAKNQKEKTHLKLEQDKQAMLLGYFIKCLQSSTRKDDWGRFDLKFKKPEEYKDRDDFVSHIQRQAYWIDPKPVSKRYVDEKVEKGEVFLFKIHCKDFYDFGKKSDDSKNHTVNLFTKYFLELFSHENIKNIKSKDPNKSIFELDGKAEIRFRPKTDEVKLKIYQKNGKNVTYLDKRDGNKKKEVIQHKRFAKDALILHLKTRLNFGKSIDLYDFNKRINTGLLSKVPVRVLGMDRGENNLIYYCILDENGEIEKGKCESLNKVGERIKMLENGHKINEPVDYFQLLVDREEKRDWEQKNWQKITPIKDIKKAYLGNVTNWISKEIFKGIDKNMATFNVLEDLSGNFKRTRFFRERQVYQGFENALIKKLGYLVDKKRGNFSNAYQFAPIVESVEKMEKSKQIGTVAYVYASYTSKICPSPQCGWRKRLYIKNSETKKEVIKLLNPENESENIKISYDKVNNRFCFKYHWEQEYKHEEEKKKYSGFDEVFSNVSRTRWDNEQSKSVEFKDGTNNSITNKLKELFGKKGINLDSISQQLVDRQKEIEVEFFQSIVFYFNLIMQIRNYDKAKEGSDADYIQCPSCLFDSRKPEKNGKLSVITNGDANGAYNIARKGFMQLYGIRENPSGYMKLTSNKEWDDAVRDWDAYVARVTKKYGIK